MYSDKGIVLEAFLKSYLSCASLTQAQEAKEILLKTISDIDNGNLTQEKSVEPEKKNEPVEPEKQRAPKVPIDKNLARRIYEAAKKRPKARQVDIEKSLNITIGMIGKQTKKIYFMGEERTLAKIFQLGQLMSGKDAERYQREITEDYEE